jgi:signal transduction histidine kinase
LVGVEDEERERLAGAIQRRVVPHLSPIAAELSADLDVADPELPAVLDRLIGNAEKALEELRIVVRGVFPALLQRRGLVAALSAQLDATASTVALDVDESLNGRLDPAVEAAAYLFCVEVAASATDGAIRLQAADDQLVAEVRRGATAPGPGLGAGGDGASRAVWQHAVDRVEALDGRVTVQPAGTDAVRVRAVIPTDSQPSRDRAVAAQTSSSRSGPNADLGTYAEEPQSGVMSRNSASS